MKMIGTYDWFLVLLSVAIATFASFTALSLGSHVRASHGWMRRVWVAAAAIALGGGIWSMHFVAMLAFSMPGMTMSYDLSLTILSLAIALAFTGAGFSIMKWEESSKARVVSAGLLMGAGVLAMHYVGMAAMRMNAAITYERAWVAGSFLIAFGAATAAIWLAARDQKLRDQIMAACVMGIAIAGMHYAGMRAAVFTATSHVDITAAGASLGQSYVALLVSSVTITILLMALGAARLERLFQGFARREVRISLRLRVADVLRGQDTAGALHEVARLLGEYFKVSRTGFGQLDPVENVFDYDICWTDGVASPLLGHFPAAAFGEKIVDALKSGKTVVVSDLLADELSNEARTRDTARDIKTRAILVVPYVREGRLLTIVYLNHHSPRVWRSEDVAFMEEIAERARLVIERTLVEKQLRDLNATLEERVQERTEDLRAAQEALLHTQKMEAMGQLVAGLAHDFNNVLGAIVAAFGLVKRRADDPEQVRKLSGSGLEAAERGAKLTAQLLAFSRSQRIQLQPLIVCDVINALRDLLVRTLGPMIRLEFKLNPNPVPVIADPTQVEIMILNLAINARDAMPNGGSLVISTKETAIAGDKEIPDGVYVEIAVQDSGVGMDEATLRRAMEPFFTTKPVGKGTGLGLAQIYGSTRQAGGTVRLESKRGLGTTVRVLLPRTSKRPSRIAEGHRPDTGTAEHPVRILLVDDDNHLRELLAQVLQAQGHLVQQASDGPSALAALGEDLPDVAILDFAMPGMNGAELAIRIADRWPGLPLIFASGFADTAAIEAATGGRAPIVRKPFQAEELAKAMQQVLEPASA
jgi:NO-binding membrane sensor protein with MHYT domain/CheY-like chemotaxis protein